MSHDGSPPLPTQPELRLMTTVEGLIPSIADDGASQGGGAYHDSRNAHPTTCNNKEHHYNFQHFMYMRKVQEDFYQMVEFVA